MSGDNGIPLDTLAVFRYFGRMSNAKHTPTPGPWNMDRYGSVFAANGERLLANIAFPSGNHPKAAEIEANTRLIAAAPELLDVLSEIAKEQVDMDANGWVELSIPHALYMALHAALKKAKGE